MSQFRLKTLLRLREIERDQSRLQLAEAQRIEQKAADRVAELDETLAELRRETGALAGLVNIAELCEADRFGAAVKLSREEARQYHHRLATESELRRREVIEADKQVKVLEKLRQKQESQEREEQTRQATKLLDELAARGSASYQ
jgi:flagellar FliJ protein